MVDEWLLLLKQESHTPAPSGTAVVEQRKTLYVFVFQDRFEKNLRQIDLNKDEEILFSEMVRNPNLE